MRSKECFLNKTSNAQFAFKHSSNLSDAPNAKITSVKYVLIGGCLTTKHVHYHAVSIFNLSSLLSIFYSKCMNSFFTVTTSPTRGKVVKQYFHTCNSLSMKSFTACLQKFNVSLTKNVGHLFIEEKYSFTKASVDM